MLIAIAEPFDSHVSRIGLLKKEKRLAIALVISVLAHALFLWVYGRLPPQLPEQLPQSTEFTLEVSLPRPERERVPQTYPVEPAQDSPAETSMGSRPPRAQTDTPTESPTDSVGQESVGVEAEPSVPREQAIARPPKRSTLITTLGGSWDRSTQGTPCDSQERASAIRRCDDDDDLASIPAHTGRYDGHFDQAFRRLSRSASFRDDMQRVQSLLVLQAQLEDKAKRLGHDEPELAQLHSEVTQKLHRIDAKYSQVDLLKVLSAGAKFTTELAKLAANREK